MSKSIINNMSLVPDFVVLKGLGMLIQACDEAGLSDWMSGDMDLSLSGYGSVLIFKVFNDKSIRYDIYPEPIEE